MKLRLKNIGFDVQVMNIIRWQKLPYEKSSKHIDHKYMFVK